MLKKITAFLWLIKNNSLILTSFIIIVLLISCTNFRSVRTQQFYSKDKPTVSELSKINDRMPNNNQNLNEDLEISKPTIQLPSNEKEVITTTNQPVTRKIPSLREQMKLYSQEQEMLKNKVDNVQKDVDGIKTTLNEIKYVLENKDKKPDLASNDIIEKKPDITDGEHESAVDEQTGIELLTDSKFVSNDTQTKSIKPKKKSKNTKVSNSIAENNYQKQKIKQAPIKKSVDNPDLSLTKSDDDMSNAMNLIKNNDYDKAVVELIKVASSDKNPEIQSKCNYWLAESHFVLKDYPKAISYLQKVIKSKNNDKQDNAQALLAESYIKIGDVDEAKKAYRSLIESYPQSQYIPRARKMLQQL